MVESVSAETKKRVILVGAGPGDPGLLTVKGREALCSADCIIYDRLASPKLLSLAKEGCELIYVGKENHHHVCPQDKINTLLVEKAKQYNVVVRLKGGDVYVFGRGGEEALFLREHGIDFEVIPGVTSAIAGLAAAGIPITHRGIATGFHVLTAHGKEDRLSNIDFSKLTDETETCVFLMGLSHVREVAQKLILAGRRADTPAAVISCATTQMQRSCIGTLSDIADKVERKQLISPAIIVVGNVVSLSAKLWSGAEYREAALEGKIYIVPVIRGLSSSNPDLGALLREQGALVHEITVGSIETVPFSPERESVPDWMIFTSRNAVESFFAALMEAKLDMRSFAKTKIAVIGDKTAKELEAHGVYCDFLPTRPDGRTLAEEFGKVIQPEDSIWYLKGLEGSKELADAFAGYKGYKEIVVYENHDVSYETEILDTMRMKAEQADGIFFTSASAVRRILKMQIPFPKEIYSIGPATTEQLTQCGIHNAKQAKNPSYEELVRLSVIANCTDR